MRDEAEGQAQGEFPRWGGWPGARSAMPFAGSNPDAPKQGL